MSLVDPVSKSPFSVSGLAKIRWAAETISWFAARQARSAARRQDWRRACNAYAEALKFSPHTGALWVQLGHGLGNMGRADAAQIAYDNATRAEPRLALGHKHLGFVRFKTSLHEEAMQSLACALFLAPHDADLRNLLAKTEDEAKLEARLAIAALTLADEQPNPGYIGARATFTRAKARSAARRRQWSEAERRYRRLTQLRPRDAYAFIQLGHARNEQNKQKDAEAAYRQAVAAAPLLPDGWLHLGYVLTAQKEHLLAREAFAIVNRLAPGRRREHPILATADPIARLDPGPTSGLASAPGLICPTGLGHREKSIWLCLATQIESKS